MHLPSPPIVEGIRAQCILRPHATAVVDQQESVGYAQLWRRAAGYAQRIKVTAGPGELVAIAADRGVDFVAMVLGAWLADCVYLPLDMSNPDSRLKTIVAVTAPAAILASTEYAGVADLLGLPSVGLAGSPVARRTADQPTGTGHAYVICTSGTTGTPKGVLVTHAGLANLATWFTGAHGIGPGDRMLHTAALGFDASVLEIWPQLAAGATVVCCPDEDRLLPDTIAEQLAQQHCTRVFLATTLCEAFLAEIGSVPGLRTMFTGGDRLTLPTAQPREYRLVNMYGPTEATVVATSQQVSSETAGDRPPIGRPIDGARVLVCDDVGLEVDDGTVGELYIGGAGVAAGYLGAPDLTRQRFVTVDGQPGRWYRTGDLAAWSDGALWFHGRVDDEQLKVRGVRVAAAEIEQALLRVSGVRGGAVTMVGSGITGRLTALLVGATSLTVSDIRAELLTTLPSYLVPSRFVFVDRLPLGTNGKLDRAAVRARATREAVGS